MSGIFLTSSIILVFISLILGNIIPVYSIDNKTRHGAHMSMGQQNQQNTNIEEHGVLVNNSSNSYAEQIMTSCQDDDDPLSYDGPRRTQ